MVAATLAGPVSVRPALTRGRHDDPGPRSAIFTGKPSTVVERRRVLVVDDNAIDGVLVERLLARDGHDVVIVENGAQAVQAVATGRFDVVFMDMEMPLMDGLSATRAIRALPPPLSDVVVVALTANTHADEVKRCVAAGMNGHLAKPAGRASLRRAITALVLGPEKLAPAGPH